MLRFFYKPVFTMIEGQPPRRYFDIAANLTDVQFGKHGHDDRDEVVKRALGVGCTHLLIAAGCMEDIQLSYQLCQRYQNSFLTIGVHPCRAAEPFQEEKYKHVDDYFLQMEAHIASMKDKLVAIGECGLDYDRLNYSTKQQQLAIFPHHFGLAEKYKLPMYLHNRNTGNDFYDLVKANRHRFPSGVVHSFTGSKEEIQQIVELDLFVGINGCSLKTKENLEILHHIPLNRIMLETDSPYCQIRNSHASSGMVKTKFPTKNKKSPGFLLKGRNQPCKIVEVLEVVSQELQIDADELAKIAFANSLKLFCPFQL